MTQERGPRGLGGLGNFPNAHMVSRRPDQTESRPTTSLHPPETSLLGRADSPPFPLLEAVERVIRAWHAGNEQALNRSMRALEEVYRGQ